MNREKVTFYTLGPQKTYNSTRYGLVKLRIKITQVPSILSLSCAK